MNPLNDINFESFIKAQIDEALTQALDEWKQENSIESLTKEFIKQFESTKRSLLPLLLGVRKCGKTWEISLWKSTALRQALQECAKDVMVPKIQKYLETWELNEKQINEIDQHIYQSIEYELRKQIKSYGENKAKKIVEKIFKVYEIT